MNDKESVDQVVINFRIPKARKEELDQYARDKGVSTSYVLRQFVEVAIGSTIEMPSDFEWKRETSELLRKILELIKDLKKHDI